MRHELATAVQPPKYARWEHERKYLVAKSRLPSIEDLAGFRITDRYLDDSRLRVRRMTEIASGKTTCKLCKKYPSDSMYSQPIVNAYLSSEEFELLRKLPGRDLAKTRFHDRVAGRRFAIDVFGGALDGLVLCEIEAASLDELMRIEFPPYAEREVTEDAFFTGGALSRLSAAELAASGSLDAAQ